MRRQARFLSGVTLLLLGVSAFAETVAVAMRPTGFVEESTELIRAAEQGSMDEFFGQGHIVFDLDIDPEDEVFSYRVIDAARDGGAAYAFLVEIDFQAVPRRGLYPILAQVTVIDVRTESVVFIASVEATSLPGNDDLPADALCEALGGEIIQVALSDLNGGDSAW